jgi:hypothetical protein
MGVDEIIGRTLDKSIRTCDIRTLIKVVQKGKCTEFDFIE